MSKFEHLTLRGLLPNNTDIQLVRYWASGGKINHTITPIIGWTVVTTFNEDENEPIGQDIYPVAPNFAPGDFNWALLYADGTIREKGKTWQALQLFLATKNQELFLSKKKAVV